MEKWLVQYNISTMFGSNEDNYYFHVQNNFTQSLEYVSKLPSW